jgi:hypothetical protein
MGPPCFFGATRSAQRRSRPVRTLAPARAFGGMCRLGRTGGPSDSRTESAAIQPLRKGAIVCKRLAVIAWLPAERRSQRSERLMANSE